MGNGANIMARINRNTQCFLATGTVDLEKQKNLRILLKLQTIELSNPGFLNDNPEYVKQRTVEWFNNRRWSRITASTMLNALGLQTLKGQKDHFEEFVMGKVPSDKDPAPALVHGIKHEVYFCTFIIFFIAR